MRTKIHITRNQNQFSGASGNWQPVTGYFIPPDYGTIQESYQAPATQDSRPKTVILINKYGVNLVALEGASAPLDPQIFKSFPVKELLKKVFKEYQERGEVTGGTASAIFSAKGGPASER